MHYHVDGQLIKSENTAKPYTQPSKAVLEYLCSQKRVKNILDFGCGKLRYSHAIVSLCDRATFVDSRVQLFRSQMVRNEKTTVAEYIINNYRNCQTVAFEDLGKHHFRYDFITCINVLSAIPCENTLYELLGHAQRLLHEKGKAVFINQHRNSYFKKFNSGKNHLYGYVYNGNHRVSYYGILGPEVTKNLLNETGFSVVRAWCVGESTFIEAK
jgi:2-polyprenyl-3-methyl-5-hydroxy-6-metoxy-1,4-benzoquinol methylase